MNYVEYHGIRIPVLYETECCVTGGGTAGCAAAISALKCGVKTLVVEKGIALGGSQTLALVTPMMSTKVAGNDLEIASLIKRKQEEYGDRIRDESGNSGWFNADTLSLVYQDMITAMGGEILYNADLVDVIMSGKNIRYAVVNTIEGVAAVSAMVFVDSTGDARLSRHAGVPVFSGDEQGNNQAVSLRFEMGGIDIEKLYQYMKSKKDTFCPTKPPFYEIAMVPGKGFVLEDDFMKGINNGELEKDDIKYFQAFAVPSKPGTMSFNCPEIPVIRNSRSAVLHSQAIIKGRQMMHRISSFLIKNMPGFENAYFNKEASMLGVRESYRIKGRYILTKKDYFGKAKFDDAVSRTAYSIDIHSDEGLEFDHKFKPGEYYEIPFRSMITGEVENLVVAGRCISADFKLQSSMRIQPTCRDTGEAAGKACAYSVKNNVKLNEINWEKTRRLYA